MAAKKAGAGKKGILRVFVAASPSALDDAKRLADALAKRARIIVRREWTLTRDGDRTTMLARLMGVARNCDLATIFYTGADVQLGRRGSAAHDGTVFEAGLFLGHLGLDRRRVLLVTPLTDAELPPELIGLKRLRVPSASGTADWMKAAGRVVSMIERQKPLRRPVRDLWPCDGDELMKREGRCQEGQDVYVIASRPLERSRHFARTVRRNIDAGVRYQYFFQAGDDEATVLAKLVKALVAPKESPAMTRAYVLRSLQTLSRGFRIHLLPNEPPLDFCIHNASHPDEATCFIRRDRNVFFCWYRGAKASKVAKELRAAQTREPLWRTRHIVRGTLAYRLDDADADGLKQQIVEEITERFGGIVSREEVAGYCFGERASV